jgi:hypothetical protein
VHTFNSQNICYKTFISNRTATLLASFRKYPLFSGAEFIKNLDLCLYIKLRLEDNDTDTNKTKAKKKIMRSCMLMFLGVLDAKDYNLTMVYKNPDVAGNFDMKMLLTIGKRMLSSNEQVTVAGDDNNNVQRV